MKISIIIPTLNGGSLLIECLNSIINQESAFIFDIIIIDSGSNDSSITTGIKILKNAGITHKLIVIDSSQFNHGETRNIAIRNTTSDVLVFLTQDSIPNSETWLVELVSPFTYFKQLAGVLAGISLIQTTPRLIVGI